MKLDQAKRLKELEAENARLKRVVADLALGEAMLKEVAKGNFSPTPPPTQARGGANADAAVPGLGAACLHGPGVTSSPQTLPRGA